MTTGKGARDEPMKDEVGFVYVISNEAMPGMVKIGVTQSSPARRAKELVSTGVPAQFDVDYFCVAYNPYELEAAVHKALDAHRTRGEWFGVSASAAIAAIQNAGIRLLDECWNEKFRAHLPEDSPTLANEEPSQRVSFFARQTSTAKTFCRTKPFVMFSRDWQERLGKALQMS